MKYLLSFAFVLTLVFSAQAQQEYLGKWKTIDDNTGKAKAHVEIYQQGDKLYGKIVKILDEKKADKLCTKCTGAKKNQRLEGLVILEQLGKKSGYYGGGSILDPENGKTYKCYIEMDSKDKLKVRGYLGVSYLGRTQYWYRMK